jgi:hypothetical protein
VSIACISTASSAAYGQQPQAANKAGAGWQASAAQAMVGAASGAGSRSGSTWQAGPAALDYRGGAGDASHAAIAAMDGTMTLNTLV